MIAAVAVIAIGAVAFSEASDNHPSQCTITVISGNPSAGTVSEGGTVQYGDLITLNAAVNYGYSFIGWYDGSTLLSSSQSYAYKATKDATITAEYSLIHDASFNVKQSSTNYPATLTSTSVYNVGIASRSWTYYDVVGERTLSYSPATTSSVYVSQPTAVKITQTVYYTDGRTATSSQTKIVDGTVTKHFSWRYQGNEWYSAITNFLDLNEKSATWDVPFSFSWYYNALTSSLPRNNAFSQIDSFVTYNDPEIRAMAQALKNGSSGMSDIQRVNYVLKFVQSIPYAYDIDTHGVSDYWDLPAEILWEGKGDCEDHAFLFASLVKAMGYNVVLYQVNCYENGTVVGHMAAGVAVSGGSGAYTTTNGVKYYYCEATAIVGTSWWNNANVGYQPSGYVIQQVYAVA